MDVTAFNQPGVHAIHRADEGLVRTAAQVARMEARVHPRSYEMETSTVHSVIYERQGFALIRVVPATDETTGTLLNIRS